MNSDAIDRLFAERLGAVRAGRGQSGKAVAAKLGRHERFIYDIESRRRKVSIGEAVLICAALGVDPIAMADAEVPLETLLGGAE